MEVGSFVGELVRGNEKMDVEDVREMVVNLMSLPWLDAVTRDVSNFKTKMTFLTGAKFPWPPPH